MTLEAIGQKLKAAREAQGLSLRQIYERTKIPINHLQSIDTGAPADLPEPVYVAGFIKRYAECIGLDGQVLADEYRREEYGNGTPNGNGGKQRTRQAVAQQVYVTPEYLKHTRIDQAPPSWKLWPFYGFAIIVVIGIVSYFSNHSQTPQPDPTSLSLKDASRLQATQGLTGQPGATTIATAPVPPVSDKVVLTVTRHVWVEVKKLSNGDPVYTGNLESGQTREFQDSQGLRIRAGDGGNLSVEFKGKIEPFGQNGKVVERTFDTHSIATSPVPGQDATAGQATSSAGTATSTTVVKPRKVVRKPDSSSTATRRRHSDDGYRSIGGDDGGTRSIDVPYRYSEGRLDSN